MKVKEAIATIVDKTSLVSRISAYLIQGYSILDLDIESFCGFPLRNTLFAGCLFGTHALYK